jgi:hypothetical protein
VRNDTLANANLARRLGDTCRSLSNALGIIHSRFFHFSIVIKPLNVTRLESLIRDSDASIGIYPFDEGGPENPTAADLANAARSFRLKLDIAGRSRKPDLVSGVVRYDTRHRSDPGIAADSIL